MSLAQAAAPRASVPRAYIPPESPRVLAVGDSRVGVGITVVLGDEPLLMGANGIAIGVCIPIRSATTYLSWPDRNWRESPNLIA